MIERVYKLDDRDNDTYGMIAKDFFARTLLPGVFCWPHFHACLSQLLAGGGTAMWRSMEAEEITGVIIPMQTPNIFTKELFVTSMLWWVKPGHVTFSAVKLLKVAEQWARDVKAKRFFVGRLAGYNAEQMRDFYNEHGYTELETYHYKELECQ